MPVIHVPVAGTFILIDFDNHKISPEYDASKSCSLSGEGRGRS